MWLLWSVFQQQREPATAALPEVTATETNTGRAAELRGTCVNELRKSSRVLRWGGVIRDWAKAWDNSEQAECSLLTQTEQNTVLGG